ncbi:unnamed protein product, partial [Mesorhabditis belari]|uniref:Uncharacterized protein n=1 Tax=Mesorhabditis belari TaxID=2138241 RepID=A0AAF3EB63_9BILA
MGNTKSTDLNEEKIQKPRIGSLPDDKKGDRNGTQKRSAQSARASMSSQGNRKPVLNATQRTIIKYCLDNAKDDIGERILRRAVEKKDEFRSFIDNLPRDQRYQVAESLKRFLREICDNLMDSENIERKAADFGATHVQFRAVGFKPDYFVCTADAVTTECTFLDAATHGASDTASAWSQLTSFVFSAVRDGYYQKLREQRKASNAFRNNRQSFDVSTDGSTNNEDSRRSASPNDTTSALTNAGNVAQHGVETGQSEPPSNFLSPPTVY